MNLSKLAKEDACFDGGTGPTQGHSSVGDEGMTRSFTERKIYLRQLEDQLHGLDHFSNQLVVRKEKRKKKKGKKVALRQQFEK